MIQTPDTVLQTRFDLKNHDDKKTETALRRRLLPYWWAFILVDIAMFIGLYVAAVWLFQWYGIGALVFIVGLIIFRQTVVLGMKVFQNRTIAAARRDAPIRQGDRIVSFNEDRIQIEHPGFTQSLFWSHALDVISTKNGLLIVYGGMDAISIPATAMPEGQSQAELKSRIENWIRTANRTGHRLST
ncbi:MAG: YcxB family protein [Litoreibacter sp.]